MTTKRYEKLDQDPVAREQAVLAFWRSRRTFERTLEATADGPRYVFYEGPPTANGRPHFGHLMPRVYKDLFPRYKTMRGYYVGRKGGWDTHGLPVELEVEKEIRVNSKPEIEAYGVERFVQKCKESVWRYKAEWERMIERMGFWIDLESAYVTYTNDYIESVWWELKTIYDRGFLYQGHKTLPYCPRCGTGLSSHEVAQGYREVEDPSVSVRMPIVDDRDAAYERDPKRRTSLLTWTTTPWTLPANVALAIALDAAYVEIEQGEERLILARALLERAVVGPYRIVREVRGAALIGLRYEPPYRLTDAAAAHRVVPAGFVNLEDGTGIVHIASAFGEDDYRLGQEIGLPFVQPVDLSGRFTDAFPLCAGQSVKDADPVILEDLGNRGLLYRSDVYRHDYPFCWRCDTPLLYYAMDSWYIRTTAFQREMIENNAKIRWYPAHVGEGRLADFLANLKDWALSRDRYWGTPLNIWVCEACGTTVSVGSRAELVERAADPALATDVEFHRPYIDRVHLRCAGCGGTMRRVPYVIDTWFDSGSMHTAQWHYPFENEDRFRESFPADFICEAMEQTRGWFYTLLATATIVHGEAPYRNCIGTGLGLDESGLKMSKSKGNVLDPWELIDRLGADCIRWYLCSSSAPWKSKRFSVDDVKEPLYRFLDTVRNTHDFFALYASIDGYDPDTHRCADADRTILDRWICSRLAATARAASAALDGYDVVAATSALEAFVDELSNWYVRLSRRRFWKGGMGPDKIAAYDTLRGVLTDLARLLAPFVPFLAEAVYQPLRTDGMPESVHLCPYPTGEDGRIDEALEREMTVARRIAALGHQARNEAGVRVRQPLPRIVVEVGDTDGISDEIVALLSRELNVESVEFPGSLDALFAERAVPNFRSLGPRLGGTAQRAGAAIKAHDAAALKRALADGSASIDVDGRRVELQSGDVQFEREVPDRFIHAVDGPIRLLLDLSIDDRLRTLGRMRELVHRIQIARKGAGFDVTDRIRLEIETDDTIWTLVAENEEEIGAEVLATEIGRGCLSEEVDHAVDLELDGHPIRLGLTRGASRGEGSG